MDASSFLSTVRERARALTPVQRAKIAFGVLLIVLGALWHFFVSPPKEFPTNSFVYVEDGAPLSVIAENLEAKRVIRSAFVYTAWGRLSGADTSVHAGRYLFDRPLTLFQVSDRIKNGDTGVASIRVTFPEGMASFEMADVLKEKLPDFDRDAFYKLAKANEGYLFPDTYFIEPGTPPEEIVKRLRTTFDERTGELLADRSDAEDIVILASLIEKEANTAEDRRLVAGILTNRLEKGMALQVDATFGYVKEVPGYVPTGEDPDIDSPYNTYLNRGLPPTAIASPGLDALIAAANPRQTAYFYYLTGRDGKMYYATTFEEHKRNREQYLD